MCGRNNSIRVHWNGFHRRYRRGFRYGRGFRYRFRLKCWRRFWLREGGKHRGGYWNSFQFESRHRLQHAFRHRFRDDQQPRNYAYRPRS